MTPVCQVEMVAPVCQVSRENVVSTDTQEPQARRVLQVYQVLQAQLASQVNQVKEA